MVKVHVRQGWLEGELVDASTGEGKFYSFKGIPYAAPPVGKLRFKAPQPPQPWEGIKKAREHGPNCPQYDFFAGKIIAESEDCLHLNVYSPNLNPGTPLTVMVFIHGGGFKFGSGDVDHFGPDYLMGHNIVLVTINYRVDALGFLCLDTEEVPGNAGLKDQVFALKWVQANISQFGGDPNNVTIFGQSAGGASCSYHLLSPLSKGLFKRAVPMSGCAFCPWCLPFEPQRRAFAFGKLLGLETEDPQELLEFLQSLPVEKLINKEPYILGAETVFLKMFHFTPVVEKDFGQNHFITDTPFNILKSGKVNDVDILMGHTNMEYLYLLPVLENVWIKQHNRYPEILAPKRVLEECTPRKVFEISDRIQKHYFGNKPISLDVIKEFVIYMNESCFISDIHRFFILLNNVVKSKKYLYKFSCYSDLNIYGKSGQKFGLEGASHLDDLMYLFDAKYANIKLQKDTKEYKMVKLVCKLFTNFAKYGNPTPDSSLGVVWPKYDADECYAEIAETLTIGRKLESETIAFWKSIFEDAGLEFL